MDKSVEMIWAEFSVRLEQFIRRRVSDPQAADDILQEVFVKIHTRLDSLRDESKLPAWVFQITRNAITDHYRRTARVDLTELDWTAPEAAEDDVQAALSASLRRMIDELPPEYREALVLDAYEGIDQTEISARLGLSVSGAKSRVQRARAKLREMLLDCCHLEFDRRGGIVNYYPRARCCAQCADTPNVTLLAP